jgi:leucyl/phenylalanyl-tRNA--protein transferase
MSGTSNRSHDLVLTPEILLRAYAAGIFPMSETRDDDELFWVDPEYRGIIPLSGFHVPRKLKKFVRARPFEVHLNRDFESVMHACAESGEGRHETWINKEIIRLYTGLHRMGHAHSVECWLEGELVGGLYGVSLKGAFFGESMFSRVRDASKVALVYLVALLNHGGYSLLDAQFVTDHLRQFGAFEIPRKRYHDFLDKALAHDATFPARHGHLLDGSSGALDSLVMGFLQSTTQTS